ncbi:MAG: beta-galactosidase [Chthoniobacteraceae bacterium]
MIFQVIDRNLRWGLAVALTGMMAFSTSMAGSGGSESDGLFKVSPLPSDPAEWNVSVSGGAVPELTKGGLGKGVRLALSSPEEEQLVTLKLKQPLPMTSEARRVGVWIYVDYRFGQVGKSTNKSGQRRGAPLRFLLRDAAGVNFSYMMYGASPVEGAWNYVECPRLRSGELGRLDESLVQVEGGLQHHLPVAPLSFVGLELRVDASPDLPKQFNIELGELCADGIRREESAFYWQSDIGPRYLFGEMPFARQPFVTLGDLLKKKGDYTVKWEARKDFYGRPVAQGEWHFPGYDADVKSRFQQLPLPLSAEGQYWVNFKIETKDGTAPKLVNTRFKIIRGTKDEPAQIDPQLRPVDHLIVVNPQRNGQVYEPGELPNCVVRVWKPAGKTPQALTLKLNRSLYPSDTVGQEESYEVGFVGAKEYADIKIPLELSESHPLLVLDLRLLDGSKELERVTQRVGVKSTPSAMPWTSRDKVSKWADLFENGNHLLSCAEWDPKYSKNTDLSQFEEWVLDVKKQNVNTIELFPAWREIEPMPGVFWWDQLDRRMEIIGKHGLKTMINLDCTRVPDWMEEESQADEEGMVNGLWSGGNEVLKSPSSPALRKYYGEFLTHISLRYRNNPNLVAYSSLTLFFDHFWADHPWAGQYVDYSEAARKGFRKYLRDVKGLSLKELSMRWGRPTMASWEAVELPRTDLFLGLATIDRPDPRPEWRDFIEFRKWCEQDFFLGLVAGTVRKYDDLRPIGFHAGVLDEKTSRENGIFRCAGSSEGSVDGYREPFPLPKRAESLNMLFHSPYSAAVSMSNILAQGNLNVQHFWQPQWRWEKGPAEPALLGAHALAGWLALFEGDLGRATTIQAGETGPAPVFGLLFSKASILYGVRTFHSARLNDYKMVLERATATPRVVMEENATAEDLAKLPCVIVDPTTRILPKDTIERLVAYVQGGGKLVICPTSGQHTLDPADGEHVLRRALGLPLPESKWAMAPEYRQPGEYNAYFPFAITGKGTPGEQSLSEPGQTASASIIGGNIFQPGRKLVFRLGPYSMYNRDDWGDWAHMLPYFVFGRYQEKSVASGTVLANWTDGGVSATLHNVGNGQVLCLWGTPGWYNWREALDDLAKWAGPAKATTTENIKAAPYIVSPEGFKGYILELGKVRWAVIRNESTGWTSLYIANSDTVAKRQKEAPRGKGTIKLPGLTAANYKVKDLTPLLSQGYEQILTGKQLANEGISADLIPGETRIFRLDPVE